MPMKLKSHKASVRAFLAVGLNFDLRQRISEIQQELQRVLPTVNWVRPESIHLTLKFLGSMDPSLVEQVLTAIEPVRKNQAPIALEFQGLGVFPHIRQPRILWVGCPGDTSSLLNFVSRLEMALEPLGFPPEAKLYHPHLTLARIKHNHSKIGGILKQAGLLEQPCHLGMLPIDRVTLFRSDVSSSGAEYMPLWVVPLSDEESSSSTSREAFTC